jgi:uncharacterized SAM-binding protein YcdF (DUF218 family)
MRRRAGLARWQKVSAWFAVAALLVLAGAVSPGEFELRKFVGACLMPAGLVWLGLLAFARVLAQRAGRALTGAALALWLLYTLAGNAWLGSFALERLQRTYSTIDPFGQGRFDAVLVLGGGVEVGDDGSPTLTSAGDRVVLAVRLYRAGQTPLLLTTGPYTLLPGGKVASDAAATAAIWRELGVPEGSIVLLEGPRTTTDEVQALKTAVAERGWRRVGLLTSAWHLPRAMRLCRRYGVEAVPLPAEAVRTPPPRLRWLVPQQDGFQSVQTACWEILGALAGR